MSAGAPIHREIMLSLADEIRQTIEWLAELEDPPANELTQRLHTLREAASVAGLETVGSLLNGLESEISGEKDPSRKIVRALDRLSGAILAMAESLENKQLDWVDRALGLEQTLNKIAVELARGTDRLAGSAALLQSCLTAPPGEDREPLLSQLTEDLGQVIAGQKLLGERLRESLSALRTGTRTLVGDLSGLLTIPLLPALVKLREEVRVLGRDQGKPVSLLPRCSGVEVGSRQVEPLGRVLEYLVKEALQEGIETPQQRRKAGKPTVGVLRITAQAGKSILVVSLQDDGRPARGEPKVPRALRKDLLSLRARLLKEPDGDQGQHLTLQVPVWRSTIEVLPVGTPAGELLVPLGVVGEVFTGEKDGLDALPVVSLQRRAADTRRKRPESGVVFEVAGWRGVMYAELLNTHFRVVPSQPEAGDPPWVIGRVRSTPVVHPLPFMELTEEQVCLFPSTER
jgi:chemotaxis protein histidine kinase CheA